MIVIDIPSNMEALSVALEIEKESLLLIIVYHMVSLGLLVPSLMTLLISELPTQHRILIIGDFNLDQMLPYLIL